MFMFEEICDSDLFSFLQDGTEEAIDTTLAPEMVKVVEVSEPTTVQSMIKDDTVEDMTLKPESIDEIETITTTIQPKMDVVVDGITIKPIIDVETTTLKSETSSTVSTNKTFKQFCKMNVIPLLIYKSSVNKVNFTRDYINSKFL